MKGWVALLVLATGCRQVFGIDEVGTPDADRIDAPAAIDSELPVDTATDGAAGTLRIRLRHDLLANNQQGKSVITTPAFDPSTTMVRVDGMSVALTGDATYETPVGIPGARHAIRVASPRGELEFQTDAVDVLLPADRLGRAGTGTLSGTVVSPSQPSAAFTTLVTTGVFSQSSILGPADTGHALEMQGALYGSTVALVDPNDRLYFSSFAVDSAIAASYYTLNAATNGTFTRQGTSYTVPAPTAITPDLCTDLMSMPAAEATRLTALGYDVGQHLDWVIVADAAPMHARSIGIALAAPTASRNDGTVYHVRTTNPFPGTAAFATLSVPAIFPFGEASITGGTQVWVPLANTCATSSVTLAAGTVTAPTEILVAGANVTKAAMVALPPGEDIEVTWGVDGPPADRYEVIVYTTVPSLTAISPIYVTTTPSVRIPKDLFTLGTNYGFEIVAERGYPNIASGDFATLSPSYGRATRFSGAVQFRQ